MEIDGLISFKRGVCKFRWLNKFSWENLERIQKVLKIILDTLEFQEINRIIGNKIPLKRFEKEGLYYDEVKTVLSGINKEGNIIQIKNELIKQKNNDVNSWEND